MQHRLIATTPSLLLASALASVAQNVGGYKDGFPAGEAYALLHNLFANDLASDETIDAFERLKSIWDRSEGASQILDNIGSLNPEVEIDLDAATISVNGIDTRSELQLQVASKSAMLNVTSAGLRAASKVITAQIAEIDRLKGLLAAAGVMVASPIDPTNLKAA